MQIEHRQISLTDIHVKQSADGAGAFSGYGAIFDNVDSYGDTIRKGAFSKTLREWSAKGKLPKMLLQHGGFGLGATDMMPIGKWDSMSEDSKGLKVEGHLFAMDTDVGRLTYDGLKSGELDSLSIGFQTINAETEVRDSVEVRVLTEIKLWEVSIVTFPANDKAKISSVKTLTLEELRELEAKLRDGGLSQREAVIASAIFKKWLHRDVAAPVSTPRDEVVPGADEIVKSLARWTDSTWAGVFKV